MSAMPTMQGTIERRLLVNYRVDPDVLASILPAPFRPQVIDGVGLAGICLIRLGHLRPVGVPAVAGITSENAAHRVAVEWDGHEGPHRGVYIPRRDTSSRLTALVGGHLFPGEHHRAQFQVQEEVGRYQVAFTSLDGTAHVSVVAHAVAELPSDSVFASMAEASAFFQAAPLGYSPSLRARRYDGLELSCGVWRMEPLVAEHSDSSFFDDAGCFPAGSAQLDSALLMRDIPALWKARPALTSQHLDLGVRCA